ncbi:MAG TPA: helix-turn-helix transcriptional regulator [Alphaproteobacteria bacterium]|nr:helix-turn-helix transcriptional regulator [Alphaproteobacteria bacterium]
MPMSGRIHLGRRVRRLREEKGWTQSELAAHLPGVRQQSIDQLEQGRVKRPRFLPELAEVLGTHVQWLLTGHGKRLAPRVRKPAIDAALMHDVLVAVDHMQGRRGKKIAPQQKAKLICALYELMRAQEHPSPAQLAEAASNIVGYDEFLKRVRKR